MKNLFVWEIKKNVKRNAIIGISVAAVVLLILFAVVYNLLADLVKDIMSGEITTEGLEEELGGELEINGGEFFLDRLTKQDLEELKEITEHNVAELEKEYKKNKNAYDRLFAEKSILAEVDYALAHGIYDKEARLLGLNYDGTGDGASAEGFVTMYGSVIALVVLIYGIIYGAQTYSAEYKSGTIKLVMTRPVKKSSLTLAKLLSMYATVMVAFLVPVLISYAYGAIAFGTDASVKVIYSFNASSAGITTVGALTFGTIINNLINILVMATLSFALATVTRNSAVGIIVSLAVVLGIGGFFSSLGITAFTLSYSLDFMKYFGVGDVVRNGNFFVSLAVVVFYLAASLVAVFLVTEKRDVY